MTNQPSVSPIQALEILYNATRQLNVSAENHDHLKHYFLLIHKELKNLEIPTKQADD